MIFQFNASKPLIKGAVPGDAPIVVVTDEPTMVSGNTSPISYYDADGLSYNSATVVNNKRISVFPSLSYPDYTLTIEGVGLTYDQYGLVTNTTGATVVGSANVKTRLTEIKSTFSIGPGNYTINKFTSFKAGSVGEHCLAQINALVSGKTPSVITQAHMQACNFDSANPVATVNPSAFCASLDWTGISVMNWGGTAQEAKHPGVLISPRHLLTASHYPTNAGSSTEYVVFKDSLGNYQKKTVVSSYDLGNDIRVLLLNSAVTNCKIYPVLPQNYMNYLHSIAAYDGTYSGPVLPVLSRKMHDAAGNWYSMGFWNIGFVGITGSLIGYTQAYFAGNEYVEIYKDGLGLWSSIILGGDSGGPSFTVINGEPVFLGTFHYANYFPPIHDNITTINSAMVALATAQGDNTPYALVEKDLSAFTQFLTP